VRPRPAPNITIKDLSSPLPTPTADVPKLLKAALKVVVADDEVLKALRT
jgi:hypothetical protein